MFQIKGLSVKYSEIEESILENLNFLIDGNFCVGIVGDNGCGKTTFAHSILGIIPFYHSGIVAGEFRDDQSRINLLNRSLVERLSLISYVFQDVESQILFGTVADILGLNEIGTPKKLIFDLLDIFKAKHLIDRKPSQLSTGESQKIALISAIKNNPKLIIYDEATSALDPLMKREFSTIVKQLLDSNKSIILLGQKFNDLDKYCNIVFTLNNKQIYPYSDKVKQPRIPDFTNFFACLNNLINFNASVNHMFHHFPGNNAFFLDVKDIEIKQGESIAVVGINGSGKTTFLNALNGFFKPKNISVSFNGIEQSNLSRQTFTVFNSPSIQITEATIGQELELIGVRNIDTIISYFPFLIFDKDPFSLSFGQQRILTMIAAILSEKQILIFDEPELGLDENNISLFKEFVKWNKVNSRKAIIYVTHDMKLAKEYSDRILMFNNGKNILDVKTDCIASLDSLFIEA